MDKVISIQLSPEDDINPAGLLAIQLLHTLSQRADRESAELALDLASFCRTLVTLSARLKYGYVFSPSDIQNMKQVLSLTRSALASEACTAAQLASSLTATCSMINQVLACNKYVFALPAHHLLYPWEDIVQRIVSGDRYDLQKDCILETDSELQNRVKEQRGRWEVLQSGAQPIFEHIGRLDGGERMYDPFFLSRTPGQAREFFTTGRVFTMLWSTVNDENISNGAAHYDYNIERNRQSMVSFEGSYTGPFEGPLTARWFLVISGGASSSLCLPIIALSYLDPDPQQYRRITMSTQAPQDPGEIQIQSIPRPHYEPGPKRVLDIPPPHLLPTSDLPLACSDEARSEINQHLTGQKIAPTVSPERARIKNLINRKFYVDLKRMVEVESGIKTRNVGIVVETEAWKQVRTLFTALTG